MGTNKGAAVAHNGARSEPPHRIKQGGPTTPREGPRPVGHGFAPKVFATHHRRTSSCGRAYNELGLARERGSAKQRGPSPKAIIAAAMKSAMRHGRRPSLARRAPHRQCPWPSRQLCRRWPSVATRREAKLKGTSSSGDGIQEIAFIFCVRTQELHESSD